MSTQTLGNAIVETFDQDPDETVIYPKDWTATIASFATGVTLDSCIYVYPSQITEVSKNTSDPTTTCTVSIGATAVVGTRYRIGHRAKFSDGQEREWVFDIRVKDNKEGT